MKQKLWSDDNGNRDVEDSAKKIKFPRKWKQLFNKCRKSLTVINVASYDWPTNKAKYSKEI